MRDIATKSDGSTNLNAAEWNSTQVELENAVTKGGLTLDPAAGPDANQNQLAEVITRGGLAAVSYKDSGSANTFVLAPAQTYQQPTAYFDGMTVSFKAASTNTGACTINVNSIGAVAFTQAGGGAFTPGLIGAGNMVVARYFSGDNRFEEVANTTPDIAGPAAPNQIAIYSDAGSASTFTLTIEPGFNRPTAFTDQMAVLFKAAATNDGSGTHPCNIPGLGTKDVVEKDGANPAAGRITAEDWVLLVFREVRDKFEIAFVHEKPKPDVFIPATVSSSSGTVYNLAALVESRAPTAYVDGMVITFKAPVTNTGALDINLNSLGAKDVRRGSGGGQLVNGEIKANAGVTVQFDAGADFFRIVSNSTVRGRVTKGSLVAGEVVNAAGETKIEWQAPDRDDQGLYDASNLNFKIPAGKGIKAVDISVSMATNLPSQRGWGAQVRRTRGGTTVNVVGDEASTNVNTNLSMCFLGLEVQDNDVFNVFAATSSTTNLTAVSGIIGIKVAAFEGEE